MAHARTASRSRSKPKAKSRAKSRPSATRTRFIRPGWPNVIPRIVADDAAGLIAFVKKVFGASGDYHPSRPAEIRIGDSILMITGTGERPPAAAFLYVYVPDATASYSRAVSAGARSIEAPKLMPYGDLRAMVEDKWGNTWQIATYVSQPRR